MVKKYSILQCYGESLQKGVTSENNVHEQIGLKREQINKWNKKAMEYKWSIVKIERFEIEACKKLPENSIIIRFLKRFEAIVKTMQKACT